MMFSSLVDADFLETERIMNPAQAKVRPLYAPPMSELRAELDRHLAKFEASHSPVNRKRHEVLQSCLRAADRPPGLFSLQVPTGGGKTLSSLAFALRHSEQHGLRRIIYAIPFTSIIEQTARVFRESLGGLESPVLEHHSNFDPESLERGTATVCARLASENWDAPIIVTTNVQFLESLFSARGSRCRKLHRIARSVIILDEVQTLPVELLHPTLVLLQELAENYGCTIVLCTATQPAVELHPDFPIGLSHVERIIERPRELYSALERVRVSYIGSVTDDSLVSNLGEHPRSMCIVNTRRHAAEVFQQCVERSSDPSACFHLSAQMCPQHRSDTLKKIRDRLQSDSLCTVVSTQLVEAGVDLDFPVVFRAMAGLDSIAQSAPST